MTYPILSIEKVLSRVYKINLDTTFVNIAAVNANIRHPFKC